MSDGGAADGLHECPFDEDYHAWVHGSTAYVRGYRVDATCGECESELNARYEEHMVVLECPECTVGPSDEVDEWRTRPEPVTWYVGVPNTTDLTTWSFYLAGESAAIEAVPHGISVSDSFTEDGDEYELDVALPEKGTDRDLATDGEVDQSEAELEQTAREAYDTYMEAGEAMDSRYHVAWDIQPEYGEEQAEKAIEKFEETIDQLREIAGSADD